MNDLSIEKEILRPCPRHKNNDDKATCICDPSDFNNAIDFISYAMGKVQLRDSDGQMLTEEFKKDRRIRLYTDRRFFMESLVKVDETTGIKNYDDLIEYIKFCEEILKDVKTCHQAAELAKMEMLNSESVRNRASILESDRKYKPIERVEEKKSVSKITPEEKKIQGLMKLGLTREVAEGIIFAKA